MILYFLRMSGDHFNNPGSPVVLVERVWPGLSFGRYRENIRDGVEWPIRDERHTLVLHLGGAMQRLESELEGCGSIRGGAISGEVWSIPGERRYTTAAKGNVVTYAVMKLDPKAAARWLGSRADQLEISGFLGRYDPFLLQAANALSRMAQTTGDLAALGSEQMARAICAHVLMQYRPQSDRSAFIPRRASGLPFASITRITEFIHDNLGETIRLSDIADVAGMSEHQLLDGFRTEFGTTPAQYIIEQRLRAARSLLAQSSKTVTEIAHETGFSSHSHLTRTFAKHCGVTPAEFKRILS